MATTTTQSGPPPWAVPYWQDYLSRAQGVANTPYQQSPSQYVGPNQRLQNVWQMAFDQAGGSPTMGAANQQLQSTLSGSYLGRGNPYLNQQIKAAQGDLVKAWNDVAKPSWDNKMAASGSYGNAGVMQAGANAQDQLQENLGDIASNMRFNAYNTERGNQMQALGLMPSYNSAQLQNLGFAGQAANQMQGFDQGQANQNYHWWQEAQQYPRQQLNVLGGALTGNLGQTQTQTSPDPSRWSQMLGGALTGLGLYNAFRGW